MGFPDNSLYDDLKEIAIKNWEKCENDNVWNGKEAFAEDVILQLATQYPQYATSFAYPTNETEFPISPGYFDLLLHEIDNDKEGKNLENLASHLFLHLPGCTPAKNLLDIDNAMETDLMIRNLTPQSNLITEVFGRHFAVECKNWTSVVDSVTVGYFLHRLGLLHFSFGIMLSPNNITGTNYSNDLVDKSARAHIRRSYHETSTTCIVLDRNHLEQIKNEEATLRAILFEELERFRFGVSRN